MVSSEDWKSHANRHSQRVFAAFRHGCRGYFAFGLWQGYRIGETLIAAVILSAFVVGIAWVGARADSRFNHK
jgi:hypothetical protein